MVIRATWWTRLAMAAAALAFIVMAHGCGEDGDLGRGENGDGAVSGVLVLNEGLFGQGQASLSVYDTALDVVTHFEFDRKNGRSLGDTGNDIAVAGGRAFVVLQGSNALEVIEADTHLHVGTVELPARSFPFSITIDASGTRGYVPLAGGDALARVDLTALSVESMIKVGSSPTEVALVGNKAYVTNSGFGSGTQVAVVDVDSFQIQAIIDVGDNPQAVVASSGKVVVLCGGFFDNFDTPDVDESSPGSLVFISPDTDVVTNSLPLGIGFANRMEVGPDGMAYFLVDGNLASLDVGAELVTADFVTAQSAGADRFHGLGVEPTTGRIYVSDPKDFTSPGEVHVLDPDGTLVASFAGDVMPRAFGFVE